MVGSLEKTKSVSEPTPPEMSVDPVDHKNHDYFNLIVLPFVCVVCGRAFIGLDVLLFFKTFTFYIVVDSLWVLFKPKCVASPNTILIHHVVVLLLLFSLFSLGEDREIVKLMASGGLIEINTWFLIAKRNFRESLALKFFFYCSWILVRCILGPYLLYFSATRIDFFNGAYYRRVLYFILFAGTFCLNILNCKWTFDLVYKKAKDGNGSDKGL